MTALYIDGVAVTLPADFSVAIIEENPFLTENGGSTYDINLSLLDKVNAKLYKHKNRTNDNTQDIINRTAILIVNDKVFLRGNEIILEFGADEVKIQLVSDNSAFNYSFSNTKRIWEMDFGNANELTFQEAENSLFSTFPTFNFVCPPFLKKAYQEGEQAYSSEMINYYKKSPGDPTGFQHTVPVEDSILPTPCPYLIYYLEKFLEIKGLEIKTNCLREDEKAKTIYVLNNSDTLEYAKILPDWTEAQFVTEMENFFNITINIKKHTNQVEIKRFKQKLEEGVNHIQNVLTQTNKKVNEESRLKKKDYSNPSYETPTTDFYAWENLSLNALDEIIIQNFPTYQKLKEIIAGGQIEINYNINETATIYGYPKRIFSCSDMPGRFFAPRRINYYREQYLYQLVEIDRLKIKDKFTSSSINIGIIPCGMKYWLYNFDYTYSTQSMMCLFPCSNNENHVNEYFKLTEIVRGSEDNYHPEYLQVAMYAGMVTNYTGVGSYLDWFYYVPMSYIDSQDFLGCSQTYAVRGDYLGYQINPNGNITFTYETWTEWKAKKMKYSLRLLDEWTGKITSWYDEVFIDSTKPHEIYFIEQEYDVTLPFVINNKKFICEKIEYDINKDGVQEKTMKGTFYPLVTL